MCFNTEKKLFTGKDRKFSEGWMLLFIHFYWIMFEHLVQISDPRMLTEESTNKNTEGISCIKEKHPELDRFLMFSMLCYCSVHPPVGL